MKTRLLMLTVAMSCAFAGNAMALTKDEYKTQKTSISTSYKASRDKCDALKSNAKDICMSEAKGAEKVAKAELEAQYKPSAKHTEAVALAKGDAAYDTAKEKCDDLSSNAKDVCIKDAKAAHVKVKEEAKVARTAATTSNPDKVVAARKEANSEEREASYKAAKERCDAMTGAGKDTCQNDAKNKFGMK
ncbi:MAG: hypothetical protein V4772_20605 [Pseudomonadota bacterium]